MKLKTVHADHSRRETLSRLIQRLDPLCRSWPAEQSLPGNDKETALQLVEGHHSSKNGIEAACLSFQEQKGIAESLKLIRGNQRIPDILRLQARSADAEAPA